MAPSRLPTSAGAARAERCAAALAVLAAACLRPASAVALCGTVAEDLTLEAAEAHTLECRTVVLPNVTLTVMPGTTVRALQDASDGYGRAAALVVLQGARLHADGTREAPITFTTALSTDGEETRGLWGGLIILGRAPVQGGTSTVEGLDGYTYGGMYEADDSGVLRFVRVWYAGSNDEIDGITLAGVGSGTTIEYVEVAYSLYDGLRFFGGTVNARHVSVLFAGDDGIDTDLGYRGKLQFVYVMVGKAGRHGVEMGSSSTDTKPRSFPQLYNALIVGHTDGLPASVSSDRAEPALIRLREDTGGEFGNLILTNVDSVGLSHSGCGSQHITQALPASSIRSRAEAVNNDDYLWVSPNIIVYGSGTAFGLQGGCGYNTATQVAIEADPQLILMPEAAGRDVRFVDPRPVSGGLAYQDVDSVPADGWFQDVSFKGAFGSELWLAGWSVLYENGQLPEGRHGELPSGESGSDRILLESASNSSSTPSPPPLAWPQPPFSPPPLPLYSAVARTTVFLTGDFVKDGLDVSEKETVLVALARAAGMEADDFFIDDTRYALSSVLSIEGISQVDEEDVIVVKNAVAASMHVSADQVVIYDSALTGGAARRLLQTPVSTFSFDIGVSEASARGDLNVSAISTRMVQTLTAGFADEFNVALRAGGLNSSVRTSVSSVTQVQALLAVSATGASSGMSVSSVVAAINDVAWTNSILPALRSLNVTVSTAYVERAALMDVTAPGDDDELMIPTEVLLALTCICLVVAGISACVVYRVLANGVVDPSKAVTLEPAKVRFVPEAGDPLALGVDVIGDYFRVEDAAGKSVEPIEDDKDDLEDNDSVELARL